VKRIRIAIFCFFCILFLGTEVIGYYPLSAEEAEPYPETPTLDKFINIKIIRTSKTKIRAIIFNKGKTNIGFNYTNFAGLLLLEKHQRAMLMEHNCWVVEGNEETYLIKPNGKYVFELTITNSVKELKRIYKNAPKSDYSLILSFHLDNRIIQSNDLKLYIDPDKF
jgi:hypothetical protein